MKTPKLSAALLAAGAFAALPVFSQETETWKPAGTGMLRDDIVSSFYSLGTYWEFPVEIEESEQTPGRYRLVNAYVNAPKVGPDFPSDAVNYLVIDASDPEHCYVELGGTSYWIGEDEGGLQHMIVGSIADDYYNNKYSNWEKADEEGVCGTLSKGCITFPRRSLTVQTVNTEVYTPNQLDYDMGCQLVNGNSMFRLRLPGTPDTDIAISLKGMSSGGDGVVYDIAFSDDVEYVLAAVFPGEYNDRMSEQIADGMAETTRLDTSGSFVAPLAENGIYTVVAVPFADGESWTPSYLTREWNYSEHEWKNVGTAEYTESILSSNYLFDYNQIVIDEYTYSVPVQQNVESPWLIRLVDPYGPDCYPMATSTNYDSSKLHFMTFDFGDFSNVKLLKTDNLGINLNNGDFSVWSYASRVESDETFSQEIAENIFGGNIPTGRYDKSSLTATFDKNSFCLQTNLDPYLRWYEANRKGNARLVFPTDIGIIPNPAGIDGITISGDSAEEYYTVDGIRTDADRLTPGIYIVRKGTASRKILVK